MEERDTEGGDEEDEFATHDGGNGWGQDWNGRERERKQEREREGEQREGVFYIVRFPHERLAYRVQPRQRRSVDGVSNK